LASREGASGRFELVVSFFNFTQRIVARLTQASSPAQCRGALAMTGRHFMVRSSTSIAEESKARGSHRRSHDQLIGAEIAVLAITIATSTLALYYYVNWP
jgi:hypothetical protein